MSNNQLKIMVTFEQSHSHVVDDKHLDKDSVAVIEVGKTTTVRNMVRIIQSLFNNDYANWYTEGEWAKMDCDEFYPRGHIEL